MGTRTRGRLIMAFAASAIVATLLAAVPGESLAAQSASASYRPDGMVRGGYTTHWQGSHIYNTTGKNQKATGGTYLPPAGEVHRFHIALNNYGSSADRILVHAAGSGNGWQVQYWDGPTNITAGVVAGTWRTPTIPAGRGYLIHAKLTTRANADKLTRLVTISSVGRPSKADAVKFVMFVTDVKCPHGC